MGTRISKLQEVEDDYAKEASAFILARRVVSSPDLKNLQKSCQSNLND
jgi:hypothetical protein